jgi:hypothetical protein
VEKNHRFDMYLVLDPFHLHTKNFVVYSYQICFRYRCLFTSFLEVKHG